MYHEMSGNVFFREMEGNVLNVALESTSNMITSFPWLRVEVMRNRTSKFYVDGVIKVSQTKFKRCVSAEDRGSVV